MLETHLFPRIGGSTYSSLFMEFTKLIAQPGFVLIDPLEKDKKSDIIAVQDSVDKAYKGKVISVGKPKQTDYGTQIMPTVSEGDFVLYSIAGCEETKIEYNGDPRKRLVIAPFGRILLKLV